MQGFDDKLLKFYIKFYIEYWSDMYFKKNPKIPIKITVSELCT